MPRSARQKDNVRASAITLSAADIAALGSAVPEAAVSGARYADAELALVNR